MWRVLLVVFVTLCVNCRTKQSQTEDVLYSPLEISQVDLPPSKASSPFDDLREAIKDFITLLSDCDKVWFADVDPSRIMKWQLPVNVVEMEKVCDRLLSLFDQLLENGSFRAPQLDDFIRRSALAMDKYNILAYKCKKVGVRDKKPYIKEMEELRDTLRGDVKILKEEVGKILSLSDEDLRKTQQLAPEELLLLVNENLVRLRQDMKVWIEEPVKVGKPTFRYSLKASEMIANRAVSEISKRARATYSGLIAPAEDLVRAFSQASTFYSGRYFDEEEKEGPKIRNALYRADVVYRNAARKYMKPTKKR